MSSHIAKHKTVTNSLGADPGIGAVIGQTVLALGSVVNCNTPAATDGILKSSNPPQLKQKRRMCTFPGCINTVTAQSHCQKHSAIIVIIIHDANNFYLWRKVLALMAMTLFLFYSTHPLQINKCV